MPGLISKHFLWSERGWAGGGYQWESRDAAEAFYAGPWRAGIVARYGMAPLIEDFAVCALSDNARGTVERFAAPVMGGAPVGSGEHRQNSSAH